MFKVAGVSKFNGEVKVRFANDITRVKILDKNGHTDINLVELPNEMDKPEVVKYLLTTDLAQNPEYKEAIDEADEKYNGVKVAKAKVLKTGTAKAVKAPKADKVTKAVKTAVVKAAAKAKTTAKPASAKKGTKSAADVMAELQARVNASTE